MSRSKTKPANVTPVPTLKNLIPDVWQGSLYTLKEYYPTLIISLEEEGIPEDKWIEKILERWPRIVESSRYVKCGDILGDSGEDVRVAKIYLALKILPLLEKTLDESRNSHNAFLAIIQGCQELYPSLQKFPDADARLYIFSVLAALMNEGFFDTCTAAFKAYAVMASLPEIDLKPLRQVVNRDFSKGWLRNLALTFLTMADDLGLFGGKFAVERDYIAQVLGHAHASSGSSREICSAILLSRGLKDITADVATMMDGFIHSVQVCQNFITKVVVGELHSKGIVILYACKVSWTYATTDYPTGLIRATIELAPDDVIESVSGLKGISAEEKLAYAGTIVKNLLRSIGTPVYANLAPTLGEIIILAEVAEGEYKSYKVVVREVIGLDQVTK